MKQRQSVEQRKMRKNDVNCNKQLINRSYKCMKTNSAQFFFVWIVIRKIVLHHTYDSLRYLLTIIN